MDTGELVVNIPKLNEKEFFPNLEMLTTLLKKREEKVLIQEKDKEVSMDEKEDFQVEQNVMQVCFISFLSFFVSF